MSGAMLSGPAGCPFFEQLEPRLLLSSDGISAMAVQLFAGLTTTNSITPVYVPLQQVTNAGDDVTPSTEESIPLINIDDFRADARFDGIDGSGLAVVILDTGLDVDHPFFGPDLDSDGIADRIVYQWDFADGDDDASDFDDHGSNVTSIVAGSQDPGFPDYPGGIAGGADIIHLKVFEDTGAGYFSYIESALQWVVLNVAEYNIASVNMSLSDGEKYTSEQGLYGLSDELAALSNLDVVVASASGNSFFGRGPRNGQLGVAYPSADANSLSIGAVYDSNSGGWRYSSGARAHTTGPDRITPFSQRDDELTTVMAPGAPITGADRNGGTVTFHGTSQASPHVAGIAALAQQLAVQQIGRRLTTTEFANLLASTGVTVNDGDDEDDNVPNTGLDFPRVDMLALGNAILAMNTNTSPVAAPDAYDVYENGTLDVAAPGVLANDTDPEGDPLTSVLANSPSHAAAFTFNDDGSFTYTPDAGYTGGDSFTYNANDGALDSNEATVTITVLPVNNAPSFTSTPVINAIEDALYSYSITADDPDVGDTLTITAPTLPAWLNLTDNGNGTATLSGTPLNEHVGDNPVTLRVADGTATADQSFTITVMQAGDVEVWLVPRVQKTTQDTSTPLPTSDRVDGSGTFWQVEDNELPHTPHYPPYVHPAYPGGVPLDRMYGEYWVEVWIRSDQVNPAAISGGSVDVTFDPQYARALSVEHGSVFTMLPVENIDNTSGVVTIGGETLVTDMGDDEYVLLGRIQFQGDAPVDEVAQQAGPYDMVLDVTDGPTQFALLGAGNVAADYQPVPDVEIRAVIYDIDDSGLVDFGDFSYFVPAFLQTTGGTEPPYTWWADFDNSGLVDFGDFSFLVPAFLKPFCDPTISYPSGGHGGWSAASAPESGGVAEALAMALAEPAETEAETAGVETGSEATAGSAASETGTEGAGATATDAIVNAGVLFSLEPTVSKPARHAKAKGRAPAANPVVPAIELGLDVAPVDLLELAALEDNEGIVVNVISFASRTTPIRETDLSGELGDVLMTPDLDILEELRPLAKPSD